MAGKKQGIKIFKGSLRTHWMKYITNVEVLVNPTCPNSISMGQFLHKTMFKMDSKFIQPGFKYK